MEDVKVSSKKKPAKGRWALKSHEDQTQVYTTNYVLLGHPKKMALRRTQCMDFQCVLVRTILPAFTSAA